MKSKDLLFWIWLSETLGAGNGDFRRLMDLYRSPYELFSADCAELERIPGISQKTIQKLSQKNLEAATRILDVCEHMGIGILPFSDREYPKLLREINTPPVLLYYKGKIPNWNQQLCIGMVGTREMSEYGMQTAYKLSFELSASGTLIVSGMAAGIDGVSAVAAMEASGVTIAVLGCGLDRAYPTRHVPLMRRIEKEGIVLSEYCPGTKPMTYHFPMRNRIISGIAQGVLVVEAGLRSGSLITAKNAILQGRDVFAVPGNPGNKNSDGTNGLLRDGAVFTLESEDILNRYRYLYAETLHPEKLKKNKKEVRAEIPKLVQCGVIDPPVEIGREEPAIKTVQKKQVETVVSEMRQPKQITERKEIDVSGLPMIQRAILEAMPQGKPLSSEALNRLGYPFGELIAALTMLEISGHIEKLPGSSYQRK